MKTVEVTGILTLGEKGYVITPPAGPLAMTGDADILHDAPGELASDIAA